MSCSRAPCLAAVFAVLAVHFASPAVAQQTATAQRSSPPASSPQAPEGPHPLARWLDAQTFNLSTRYDYIQAALERTLQNRWQTQVQMRARFKVDEAGRYSVHAGLFTGNAFDSGWNSTGVGTGEGTAKLYLKQLFLAAQPWQGIELQYGSVYPVRGQSTEITTYDNDAYLAAGRANLRRPRELFFDDITVSIGYVGYLDRPFVFDRTGAFSRQNYWQVLASKQVIPGLTVSTDYSVIDDDGMLRQGARWRVDQPFVDTLAGEYGVRLRGGSHQTAFAFSGEKRIAAVTVQLGYANVDQVFGALNGDPYRAGNRVFTTGSIALPLDLSVGWFAQKEIAPPASSNNDVRVDLSLTWSVLSTLKRAGAVPR
jgi:hypothetical protein